MLSYIVDVTNAVGAKQLLFIDACGCVCTKYSVVLVYTARLLHDTFIVCVLRCRTLRQNMKMMV